MSPIEKAIAREMAAYRTARYSRHHGAAWRALERVHILSQRNFGAHMRSHFAMLGYAFERRDMREVVGQLLRVALVPLASLTRRPPIGNTGRARVSAFRPMAVPEDLQAILDGNGA